MTTNKNTPIIHLSVRALALALVRSGRVSTHEAGMEAASRIVARRAATAPVEADAQRHLSDVARILVEKGGRTPERAAVDAARVFGPTPEGSRGTPIMLSARTIARALVRRGLSTSLAMERGVALSEKARRVVTSDSPAPAPASAALPTLKVSVRQLVRRLVQEGMDYESAVRAATQQLGRKLEEDDASQDGGDDVEQRAARDGGGPAAGAPVDAPQVVHMSSRRLARKIAHEKGVSFDVAQQMADQQLASQRRGGDLDDHR